MASRRRSVLTCPDDPEPVCNAVQLKLQVLQGGLDEVAATGDAAFGQGGREGVQKFVARHGAATVR